MGDELITRKVRVTLEYEVDVTIMKSVLGPMTLEQYLSECEEGWGIKGLDELVKYAAAQIAECGSGNYDMIGKVATKWNRRTPPAVPVHEQMARFAIDGAITSGYQGTSRPGEDHWLYPFWIMGEKLMKAEQQPAVPDGYVLVPKDELKSLLFDYQFSLVEWAEYASEYYKKKHRFEECVISLNNRAIKVLYGDAAQGASHD